MHTLWITDNRIYYAVNGNYPLAVHYRVNDKVIYRSLQSKRVVHYAVNGKGQITEGWRPGSLVKITISNQIRLLANVMVARAILAPGMLANVSIREGNFLAHLLRNVEIQDGLNRPVLSSSTSKAGLAGQGIISSSMPKIGGNRQYSKAQQYCETRRFKKGGKRGGSCFNNSEKQYFGTPQLLTNVDLPGEFLAAIKGGILTAIKKRPNNPPWTISEMSAKAIKPVGKCWYPKC